MNAMKKGEETCASENSKHEKETQKRSAFTLIQPIQSTSFRQTVHEKAKEDATVGWMLLSRGIQKISTSTPPECARRF
ncbi:unnamed protein product [Bathycoccus prasinos]